MIAELNKMPFELFSSFIDTSLGLLFYKINDFQSSAKYFQSAIDKDPTNAVALNNIGFIYLCRQTFDISEDCFKKAILYDNRHFQAYFNLAELYELTNRPAIAVNLLNKLLEFAPDINLTYYYLGRFYYKLNDKLRAKAFLEQYLKITSDRDEIYVDAENILKKIYFMIR